MERKERNEQSELVMFSFRDKFSYWIKDRFEFSKEFWSAVKLTDIPWTWRGYVEVNPICYFLVSVARKECQNFQAGFRVKG